MRTLRYGLASLCLFSCFLLAAQTEMPIDGLFANPQMASRPTLQEPPLREADLLYATKIERTLDTREKMNLPFRHPEQGFFLALLNGLEAGAFRLYSPEKPVFSKLVSEAEIDAQLYSKDSIMVMDPITRQERLQVVQNDFNPDLIVRYRIKEITYFDRQASTQRTRIIGIAPLVTEEIGGREMELALGWLYWPDARKWFARQNYFLNGTSHQVLSWADAIDMRRFTSYIIKGDNVNGSRLADHHDGRDLLINSNKINRSISNREHDVWSY